MSLSTVRETGFLEVAKKREDEPVKIYYELHGEGPEKVVLIMGLNSSCFSWEYQTKHLAETGRYTVLIFDNRGMGMSDSPSGFYKTSQLANDVIDILDDLGWTSKVHLCGVSMGGMISLELVTSWPDRFKSVVLTSTTRGKQVPTWRAFSTLSRLAFIKDPRDKVDSAISLVYPVKWMNAKPTDIENQKYLTNREMAIAAAMARIERSRPQPLRGNIGQTAACLTHFVSDEKLRKIKEGDIAVLIVTGTDDCLVNPQNSYYLHDMIGGQFEVFEGSGHGLPGEQTKRYNQLIDEHFWKSSSGTK